MWVAFIGFVFLFGVSARPGHWDHLGQPYFDNNTKREVAATIGKAAFLLCRVRNLADKSVSWIRKRDLHIISVGVHTYSGDGRFVSLHPEGSDEWTLRISPVKPADSGAYECQVSTEPKISLSFRLSVVVSKAEILNGNELFVRSGSDINLTCVTKDAPEAPSFIYWFRDKDVVNYAQRGGINVLTDQKTRTSRLLIARAIPQDSGNYTCAPSSSDPASVIVHVLSGEHPAAILGSGTSIRLNYFIITTLLTMYVVNTSSRSSFISILLANYIIFLAIVIFMFMTNVIINFIIHCTFTYFLSQS
ncbi:Basement membrane-specific heparan sulfate proteoglycan core protein [Papilio xuthus]|uniref:Basement membrane-specific heparan sulfate proteoglycan core protein n=1 Tax=Papilio xuthus TaxID=66420 RepID=A0A194Q4T7_PAPXU|nr:Basement membrane-specific heparan sulfate proteoglycan core protein [Papilio xuthus]